VAGGNGERDCGGGGGGGGCGGCGTCGDEVTDSGDAEPPRLGRAGGDNVLFLLGNWGGPFVAPRPGKGGDEIPLGTLLLEDPELTDEPVRLGGGGRAVNGLSLLLVFALGGGGGGGPLDGSQFVFFNGTLPSFVRD
jgi:hypothetical protein